MLQKSTTDDLWSIKSIEKFSVLHCKFVQGNFFCCIPKVVARTSIKVVCNHSRTLVLHVTPSCSSLLTCLMTLGKPLHPLPMFFLLAYMFSVILFLFFFC